MENKLSEKISTQLSAALLATPEELASSNELSSGYNALTDSWEVIVKYVGNIDYIKDLLPVYLPWLYSITFVPIWHPALLESTANLGPAAWRWYSYAPAGPAFSEAAAA